MLGTAIIEALQGAGLAAAGKHFPGHGDTAVDSHLDLPVCEMPLERLRAVEFVPFRAAIKADVAFMLTCHVLFPEIDEEHPATLSPRIVQALLKDELGYQGAVVTDDLDMKAIANALDHRGDGGPGAPCRLRRLPDLQRRLRQEGAGARSGHPRGRGRIAASRSASSMRWRGCAGPRRGSSAGRRPRPEPGSAGGAGAARAPDGGRGDAAVAVSRPAGAAGAAASAGAAAR